MNFVTAFLCCRAAVNAMTRGGRGRRIVNVATVRRWNGAGAGMVPIPPARPQWRRSPSHWPKRS